jgi:hypothetical protein
MGQLASMVLPSLVDSWKQLVKADQQVVSQGHPNAWYIYFTCWFLHYLTLFIGAATSGFDMFAVNEGTHPLFTRMCDSLQTMKSEMHSESRAALDIINFKGHRTDERRDP